MAKLKNYYVEVTEVRNYTVRVDGARSKAAACAEAEAYVKNEIEYQFETMECSELPLEFAASTITCSKATISDDDWKEE